MNNRIPSNITPSNLSYIQSISQDLNSTTNTTTRVSHIDQFARELRSAIRAADSILKNQNIPAIKLNTTLNNLNATIRDTEQVLDRFEKRPKMLKSVNKAKRNVSRKKRNNKNIFQNKDLRKRVDLLEKNFKTQYEECSIKIQENARQIQSLRAVLQKALNRSLGHNPIVETISTNSGLVRKNQRSFSAPNSKFKRNII